MNNEILLKHLIQFTPAETMLVIDGKRAVFKDQLKFTLMDLFFKKVLQTIEISRQASKKDPAVSYQYVVAGEAFRDYRIRTHEMVFLVPYFRNNNIKILFRHLVKMGFEHAQSPRQFSNMTLKGAAKPFFSKNILQRIFGGYSYTAEGKRMKQALRHEIALLESQVKTGTDVQEIVSKVNGNICLAAISMEMIRTIETELNREMTSTGTSSSTYWSSCGSWSTFDHGYSSGCGGSGCSGNDFSSGCGNSGCSSGCSGCGGCGGGD